MLRWVRPRAAPSSCLFMVAQKHSVAEAAKTNLRSSASQSSASHSVATDDADGQGHCAARLRRIVRYQPSAGIGSPGQASM